MVFTVTRVIQTCNYGVPLEQQINEFFNEESRKEIIKETVYVMPLPVSKPQKILSDDKFSVDNTYIQNESTVKSFSLNYN